MASGQVDATVDPAGVVVADAVPLTSECTATEGDLGTPSADPAFRWLPAVVTGTTVTIPGPNTVTVANSLTRDSGTVFVRKQVIGETGGYVGTGEDFTLHGSCLVPGHPEIPTRYADGTIANNGEVPITASIGWTCAGYEDTPSQSLLKDSSYAWAPAILDPPGTFVLTRESPTRVFLAQNPIVRVRSAFTIVKTVVDPNGVVGPAASFSGTYSCQYGSDAPVTGRWTITPASNSSFTVTDLLLTSVCTVTEDDPGTTGLPDGSWQWTAPVVSAPVTVVAGDTATVTVTNTVQRLYAGLQVTKTVVDPDQGVVTGSQFGGVWSCTLGEATYSNRFTVGINAMSTLFTPTDEVVPATATCSVTEDTPNPDNLVDESFAFDTPTLSPPDVTLVAGQTAGLGITNTVIRVYSDVTVQKVVTGPAQPLVDPTRHFTGLISCQYRDDAPIESTWSATTQTPALRSGVLVGSVCCATEDDPGATGEPVAGDSSYIWREQVISAPITVTPPGTPTPPIVVTNPTERQYGRFDVTKAVTGAVEGVVNPNQPFRMTWTCQPGSGDAISGELSVVATQVLRVGPEALVPVDSMCILTEPGDGLPELRDSTWSWNAPTFTVDGVPVEAPDRTVTFTVPSPQEDTPEPMVLIAVTNPVTMTPGEFTLTKSSDPVSGSLVQPGSTITYTVVLDSAGTVPIHDVVVTVDPSGCSGVARGRFGHRPRRHHRNLRRGGQATGVDGAGCTERRTAHLDQVVLADDAYDVLLVNLVTSPGSQNCDPSVMGAGPRRTMAAATAESCSTNHQTPPAPTPPPTPSPTPSPTAVDPPTWSGGSGDIGLPGTGFPLATLLLWVAGLTLLGSLVLLLTRRRRAAAEGAEGADGPG